MPIQIRIIKSERKLLLYTDTGIFAMRVALGHSPIGSKEKEGDDRTPEGAYYVCTRNEKSKFFLSLGLSYPNPKDAEKGLSQGLISREEYAEICRAHEENRRPPWNTALGGFIMLHGGGTESDWTRGCVALDNSDMRILWDNCPLGTPVIIEP